MTTDKPIKTILDRDLPPKHIREHFQETVYLLQEIANYGSNLILRCYRSSSKDVQAVMVLTVLLKHAVAMIDAVEILISQGSIIAAYLPTRSLFETWLYIQWILKEDSERRAKQYYVWNQRQRLEWNKRGIIGSKEHETFIKSLGQVGEKFNEKTISHQNDVKNQIDSINELLNSEEYEEINHEFDKMKNKLGRDVDWFRPRGPSSLHDMATRLDCGSQYKVFYNQYSQIMHATSTSQHISVKSGLVSFVPIRSLEGIKTLLTTALVYVMEIYKCVLTHYRPNEVTNFNRKYIGEWRKRFRSIRDVKYNFKTEIID